MQIKIQGYETLNQKLKAVREAVTVAGSRSVRKVSVTARAEWARAIANEINLPIGTIKQVIRIHHTARTSVKIEVDSNNVASLGIGRRVRAIPVIKFKPRQTRQGLTVTIKKSKGKTLIRSGFIQTLKTGHTGAFIRKSPKRFPIKELRTTAVEDVANDVLPLIQSTTDNKLKTVFDAQLRYELAKRGVTI